MMRKIFILRALVFVLFSCDNGGVDNETNPFVGTWENEIGSLRVFTATVVTFYYPNGDIYWTGTYTYNETHITVQLDQEVSAQEIVEGWGSTITIPYSFEGDIFRFNNTVLLTKKKE